MPGANPARFNLGSNRYMIDGNVYRTTTQQGYTVPDSAIHRWTFSEGSGTTVADSIGTMDATTTGGPTWETGTGTWVEDTALTFDATDDRAVAPYQSSVDSPPFSIACSFRVDQASAGDRVVDFYQGGNYGYRISSQDTQGNGLCEAALIDSTQTFYRMSGPSVTLGEPYRAVLTYDGTDWNFWVNNVLQDSVTLGYSPVNGNLDYWFGANQQGPDSFMGGAVDNVIVYNTALSGQEVEDDFYAQPWTIDPTTELADQTVLHLDAQSITATNGATIQSWTDQSSFGVTLDGNATYRSTGLNGFPSLEFDPANDTNFKGTMGYSVTQPMPNAILAVVDSTLADGVTRRVVRTARSLSNTTAARHDLDQAANTNAWRGFAGTSYRAASMPADPHLICLEFREGDYRSAFRVNGQKLQYLKGDSATIGTENMGPAVSIGQQMDNVGNTWVGQIGEVKILNHADPATLVQEEQQMLSRWGFSQPTFQYESELHNMKAHQSVVSDGTHLYTSTNSHGDDGLYKWTKDGEQVAFRANHFQDGTPMNQVCDMFINPDDGLLYGASNNTASGNPDESWVKVWDPADLSYVREHDIPNNSIAEGVFKAHGSWWVIYANADFITELDLSWNFVADHPFDYQADQTDGNSYNGMHWEGNYLYTTRHNGKTPQFIEVHEWDGSTLTAHSRLEKPHYDATQGMCKEPGEDIMWFACRGQDLQGTLNDNVAKTRFSHTNGVPDGV